VRTHAVFALDKERVCLGAHVLSASFVIITLGEARSRVVLSPSLSARNIM